MRILSFCIVTSILFFYTSPSYAAYTVRNGKIVNKDDVATASVQEHYSFSQDAYQKKNWNEVVRQNIIIIKNFPDSPFTEEAMFYLGVGYFYINEYELANENFSDYLKKLSAPKHFEEVMKYKFLIAEGFRNGNKKRLLGLQKMPKIIPAKEEALTIYEEVITALPNHDFAAQSLFGKAEILLSQEEFRTCIETFQTLIRRFSKHPLAPESYVGIAKSYLAQCKVQYPDPDFLDLAEINLRKFKQDFPREDKVSTVESMLEEMKEIYAKSLYDVAKFFERTKKANAAKIYYSQIIAKYPNTKLASISNKRLEVINAKLKVEEEKKAATKLQEKTAEIVNPIQEEVEESLEILLSESINAITETAEANVEVVNVEKTDDSSLESKLIEEKQ